MILKEQNDTSTNLVSIIQNIVEWDWMGLTQARDKNMYTLGT